MSMDAGGLAQMTYNQNAFGGGLGMPGSGFGSRGKIGNMKRLSVPPPSSISTIDENQPAPRTSRSHLLAGLRTAPKSPGFPTSAPPTQLQHPGLSENHYAPNKSYQQQSMPKTATGTGFASNFQNQQHQQHVQQPQQPQPQQQHQQQQQQAPQHYGQYNHMATGMNQVYSPHDVLAPPSIQIGDELDAASMDPHLYDELMRTNQYLAQQQARLQQQLINVTAAAQQFQHMNGGQGQESAYRQMNGGMAGLYNQQLQQGMQPVVQPVPGQPGIYTVFNPMTGQASLAFDQGAAPPAGMGMGMDNGLGAFDLNNSPPLATPPTHRHRTSPPPRSASPASAMNKWRSHSPPKSSPSPPAEKTNPLPPPSANAFRPSHRKGPLSLANSSVDVATELPKLGSFKSTVFPPTPMTGTFGPGQAREGEHPARQPRGPPSLEELVAKPTTKFEGSKNFASRQRRRAVNNLVRAGIERRGARSVGSADSGSPTSEHNITFSISSDNDDDVSIRSGSASLDGKPSVGAPRSPMISPIGSERKELKERSRERSSPERQYSTASVSSDDDAMIGGKFVEVVKATTGGEAVAAGGEGKPRRTGLLLLANAEKRRSGVY